MSAFCYFYLFSAAMNLVFAYYDDLHGRLIKDPAAKSTIGYSVIMLLLCLTGPAMMGFYVGAVAYGKSVNIDKVRGDDNA